MKRLQDPFPPEEIEWRVGSTNGDKTKGIALAYVTNRAIQNRLDEVFGVFGWRNEYREWKEKSQLCGISVKVEGEWITKWDGADDSNMEAVKGGLSDAMKRAAYQWGIGRYLYKLENIHRLKNDKRISDDDFKLLVSQVGNGKDSIKDLTKKEASVLINQLNEYPQVRDGMDLAGPINEIRDGDIPF
ncbi:hypothetical protein PC121_g22543 [Phytophthora cactorum]|nr:hypothetical protein PC121_g22543 [Phytophthora cactorum]